MGLIRSEIERLENERNAKFEAARLDDEKAMALQIEKMKEVIKELLVDQGYLDRCGIQMVNPETGREISKDDLGLRGVTFVDLHGRRFGSLTIEYHVDSDSYSLVEWRNGESVEPGDDPFERQRVNFENAQEGLKWLANFFHGCIDIPTEYRSA